MTTPTPEQLREAAAHLAKAANNPTSNSHYDVRAAEEVLTLNTRAGRAISILSGWRLWYQDGPEGAEDAAWLAGWARLGFLLTALHQELYLNHVTTIEVERWRKQVIVLVEESLEGQ